MKESLGVFRRPGCFEDNVKSAQNGPRRSRRYKTAQDGVKTAHDGPKRPKKSDRRVDYGDAQAVDGRAIVVVVLNLFYNVFRSPGDPSAASERAKRAERCRRFRLDYVLHIYVLVDL